MFLSHNPAKATILPFYEITLKALCFFYIIALQLTLMARKIIGYYTEKETAANTEADQLIVEIGNNEMAVLVKGADSKEIDGFELFQLDKGNADWNDILFEVKQTSRLLSKSYKETVCHYNFEEALIIPEQKFTATAADDYLSLLYGESNRYDLKYDVLKTGMVNAFRIRKSIHEQMNRYFVLYKPKHIYSTVIEDIYSRTNLDAQFIKIVFYSTHFIAAVFIDQQLQFIQSFKFETSEDSCYHLLNLSKQFQLDNKISHAEISGMFEVGSVLHQQLQSIFGLLTFETFEPDGACKLITDFPAHYFTPFYKLVV